jgi:hypothetical protein
VIALEHFWSSSFISLHLCVLETKHLLCPCFQEQRAISLVDEDETEDEAGLPKEAATEEVESAALAELRAELLLDFSAEAYKLGTEAFKVYGSPPPLIYSIP